MESKKDHINGIIKDISRSCFKNCFSTESFDIEKNCLDNCFEKYISTLKKTTNCIKVAGYEFESLYSYKIFPERDPYYSLFYEKKFKPYVAERTPFRIYRNYMTEEGF